MAVITKWWPARDVSRADGVWLTTDGGNNWTQCNAGLRMLSGSTIAFNPDKSAQLLLGMDGAGFYVTDVGSSTPYGGKPAPVPLTIQVENYDLGGEGVAYHDSVGQHQARGNYRKDSVDLRSSRGHVVCHMTAGEWLKYTVNIVSAGAYDLTFHAASAEGGGRFHLEANGVNVTGSVVINATGGDDTWVGRVVHDVRLAAGPQYLKLCVEAAGVDLDYFQVKSSPSSAE